MAQILSLSLLSLLCDSVIDNLFLSFFLRCIPRCYKQKVTQPCISCKKKDRQWSTLLLLIVFFTHYFAVPSLCVPDCALHINMQHMLSQISTMCKLLHVQSGQLYASLVIRMRHPFVREKGPQYLLSVQLYLLWVSQSTY